MPNTLDVLFPRIMNGGLRVLRERCVMPRLVNTQYSLDAAKKGSTIDFQISAAQTVADVTPGPTPPTPASKTPTQIQMTLDQWKYTDFYLTDNDNAKIMADEMFIPKQTEQAMRAIARAVNQYIWSFYTSVYNVVGTQGTVPFAGGTVAEATAGRMRLANTLCPDDGQRRAVLSHEAEASALNLAAFRDVSQSGDTGPIIKGALGHKLGFDWYADDDIPYHTAGTANGSYLVNGSPALGATTIPVDTGSGTFVVGDSITFAGNSQTYVITAAYAGGAGNITIAPGLTAAVADNTAITKVASHYNNMFFHKEAFGFASRPLLNDNFARELGGQRQMTVQDPVTGLVIRLTVMRQWMQTAWAFDILYGARCIFPEMACRLIR